MKIRIFLLFAMVLLAGRSLAASPEETLAQLQIEESFLKTIYGPANPQLREVQARVASLQAVPQIQNSKYFETLRESLIALQVDRDVLLKTGYGSKNPKVVKLNAQISFIQNTLEKKANLLEVRETQS